MSIRKRGYTYITFEVITFYTCLHWNEIYKRRNINTYFTMYKYVLTKLKKIFLYLTFHLR